VAHDKAGRAFVYRALVKRSDAATSLLDTLLERFFGNSPGVLALTLLEDERLSDADFAKVKRVIERRKKPQCDDWAVARSHDLARYTASLASFAPWYANAGSGEIRYIGGPAPSPMGHVPNGLRTLVRVAVSSLGKALGATLYKTSGNIDFDRALINAAKKGAYAPQTQTCRPLTGNYTFEAKTG
jgi:hypothetical protein